MSSINIVVCVGVCRVARFVEIRMLGSRNESSQYNCVFSKHANRH